jgi:hypothetical protein
MEAFMKEDDIELYLKAKNKFAYGNMVYWVALIAAAVAALTTFIPGFHGYTKYFVLAALIIGTSTYGLGSRSYVTRKTLLNILERQINSDPKALEYIAMRCERGKK